jgi:multidrug efflux pump subunit AcrA (membrane-fusion protein)
LETTADVRPEVAGILKERHVKEDREEGDLLYLIDRAAYQAVAFSGVDFFSDK